MNDEAIIGHSNTIVNPGINPGTKFSTEIPELIKRFGIDSPKQQ